MRTTTSSNNSTINFNLYDLAGLSMMTKCLEEYFMEGKTSTFNTYYSIGDYEIPFLIKIRKYYISVTEMWDGENIMRINISGQKKMNRPESLKKTREFSSVIGTSIEQYLNILAEGGLFDC